MDTLKLLYLNVQTQCALLTCSLFAKGRHHLRLYTVSHVFFRSYLSTYYILYY